MRRFFLFLAFFGALFSGWMPALSATLDAGRPAHHAQAGHTDHSAHHNEEGKKGSEHGSKAVHPVLCAACFALPADNAEARRIAPPISAYGNEAAKPLAGKIPSPLDPPPKA
ncbi:MAG: hypothetical protein QHC90_07645 [Shinella sp.]|nr:hypothetical protein [Shinella sp.]